MELFSTKVTIDAEQELIRAQKKIKSLRSERAEFGDDVEKKIKEYNNELTELVLIQETYKYKNKFTTDIYDEIQRKVRDIISYSWENRYTILNYYDKEILKTKKTYTALTGKEYVDYSE